MTICLCNTVLALTEGAKKVLQTDPHGLALTLVSVCTVFLCLLLLFGIYQLMGDVLTGKFSRKKSPAQDGNEEELAAAIALALLLEEGSGTDCAPAGKITIKKTESPWNAPERNFRRTNFK